jgi:hypothetical protein
MDSSNLLPDDPYQFLEQLPESCLKELMEIELHKMEKETDQENNIEVSTNLAYKKCIISNSSMLETSEVTSCRWFRLHL